MLLTRQTQKCTADVCSPLHKPMELCFACKYVAVLQQQLLAMLRKLLANRLHCAVLHSKTAVSQDSICGRPELQTVTFFVLAVAIAAAVV